MWDVLKSVLCNMLEILVALATANERTSFLHPKRKVYPFNITQSDLKTLVALLIRSGLALTSA